MLKKKDDEGSGRKGEGGAERGEEGEEKSSNDTK